MQPIDLLVSMYDALSDQLPPFGWLSNRIDYILDLNSDGVLIAIIPVNKNYYTPGCDSGRTSGVKPYTLWDKRSYIFGDIFGDEPKADAHQKAFYEYTKELYTRIGLAEIEAVVKFLESDPIGQLETFGSSHELLQEKSTKTNCAFRVGGTEILVNHPRVIEYANSCSVGEFNHEPVKKLSGTNAKGATLVPYTIRTNDHYHFESNTHDGVSLSDMRKYTSVLQYLIDNGQKIKTSDNTDLIYATDVEHETVGDIMTELFGFSKTPSDDKSKVTAIVSSIYDGKWADSEGSLHIIETRGMNGRVAVTNCAKISLSDLFESVKHWFTVMGDRPAVWKVLKLFEQHPHPHTKQDLIKCILLGTKFPKYLLNQIASRLQSPNTSTGERLMLTNLLIFDSFGDKMNTYSANFGRLLMVYEGMQNAAHDGSVANNVTTKFLRMVLTNPTDAISKIAELASHWESKLRTKSPGLSIYYTKMVDELMIAIASSENTTFNKFEFHVGYSAQREQMYRKKVSPPSDAG